MSTNQLQEAVTLIKSGDRQKGQQLLAELLRQDPGNENAWLWMSTLVSADKRRLCLEKALSINPGNLQAQKLLAQLKATETASAPQPMAQPQSKQVEPAPAPASPVFQPNPVSSTAQQPVPLPLNVSQPSEPALPSAPPVVQPAVPSNATAADKPQVWVTPGKYMTSLICISGNAVLAFDVTTATNKAPGLAYQLTQGISPKQIYDDREKLLLSDVKYFPVKRIVSVKSFASSLDIIWVEPSGEQKKVHLSSDEKNHAAILQLLEQKLGARYKRLIYPISRARVLGSSLLALAVVSAATGFCYWEAQGLATVGRLPTQAKMRGLAVIILLIGPNGFLCIGGLLFALLIVAMIMSLAKPPMETALLHDSLIEKKTE